VTITISRLLCSNCCLILIRGFHLLRPIASLVWVLYSLDEHCERIYCWLLHGFIFFFLSINCWHSSENVQTPCLNSTPDCSGIEWGPPPAPPPGVAVGAGLGGPPPGGQGGYPRHLSEQLHHKNIHGKMKLMTLALRILSCRLLDYRYWTNFMKQSPPCKANSCYSTTREIRSVAWNLKIHYRVHKSRPLVPIVSHISPLHTLALYLFNSILIFSSHLLLGLVRILFPSGITLLNRRKYGL
jgi:hypothetical protein